MSRFYANLLTNRLVGPSVQATELYMCPLTVNSYKGKRKILTNTLKKYTTIFLSFPYSCLKTLTYLFLEVFRFALSELFESDFKSVNSMSGAQTDGACNETNTFAEGWAGTRSMTSGMRESNFSNGRGKRVRGLAVSNSATWLPFCCSFHF